MRAPAGGGWPFVGRLDELGALRAHLADDEVSGLVVTAPAGTGKTHLVRHATSRGALAPLWCQASAAVAGVPLGALAGVIGLDDDAGQARALRRLAERAAEGGWVVVVDDAPHLDPRSADLLHRLSAEGKATVVATARSGVAVPAWLEWLWLGEGTRHLELVPLGVDDVAVLVDTVLGHLPAERRSDLVEALVTRTGGNGLFLRELLGDLRRRHEQGVALTLDEAPPHLLRVLEARLGGADPAAVAVLVAVAALGPLPLVLLAERFGVAEVDAAVRAGHVVLDEGGRPDVRPAHPLYAEAALAALGPAARRAATGSAARRVLGSTVADEAQRLAAVTALLALDEAVPADDLVEAARRAFAALDHDLAARVARAAIVAGDRFEARIVLGAALSGAGRADEAEVALRGAVDAAADDGERARAAGRLSVHLVAHGQRLDEADEVLAAVDDAITDPAARAFVAADRAKLATIRGDLGAVAVPTDDGDEVAVLNAAIAGAYVEAMGGRAEACRATIARALPLAEAHRAVLPWSSELVRFSGVFAALVAEGPVAASAEASAGLARAGREAEVTVGTWRFLGGLAAVVAGRLAEGDAALAATDGELAAHDLIGARALAAATRAWALGQAGEVVAARSLLDEAVVAATVDGRVRSQVAVADAWCDAVEGRPGVAVEKLLGAAGEAATGGQVVTAVLALHEAVRLGAAPAALEAARHVLDGAPGSWLVDLVVDRASADAAGDERALARLARRAEGRWPLVAAEVQAARHRLARRRGDDTAAARAALAALDAAGGLGAVRPWTLGDLRSPLSPREHEVALAVASGRRSRDVAEAAGVSVRTVENQLQNVYRKLGLGGREALAELFLPTGGPASAGGAGDDRATGSTAATSA